MVNLFDGNEEFEPFFENGKAAPAKAHKAAFPPDHAEDFLAGEAEWLALRGELLTPLNSSAFVSTEQSRHEFLEGARLLRFHGERALPDRAPQPQQLAVADILAAGHKRNALLLPRRSSKSTSAIAVALGRAAYREDYRVGILTLTSGKAGRSRFLKDVAAPVERLYPDKKTRPLKVVRIAGMEGIEFASGGSVNWLSTLEDVRGEAFDMVFLDEAGEPNDPEKVREVMGAALPTLDTRPGAQIVALGTAGRYRSGNLLWESLELGRSNIGGLLEFAFPPDTTDEELASWEPTEETPEGRVRELIELSHPGVGTLTTIESIRENYEGMTPETFAREYGSLFGEIGVTTGLIDATKWAVCGSAADLPTPPERFSFAVAPHPDQLCASIVAAWRDDDGRAVLLLLDNKRGVKWLDAGGVKYARKYSQPAVYDSGSPVALLASEAWTRARPKPRMAPLGFMDIKKAAALIVDELARENVVHFRQPDLDSAAKLTIKRKAGVNGWALGRGQPGDDITGIEAASMALLHYDESKPKTTRRKPVVAS